MNPTGSGLQKYHIEQYRTQGYAALSGFVHSAEAESLRRAVEELINGAPEAPGSDTDAQGRPVEFPGDFAFTRLDDGRHVLNRVSAPLARSAALRRAYGNPRLLACAQALYGPDFLPFAESVVIKLPQNGAAFAWHQDGSFKTGAQAERGVNFGIYLHDSIADNGCLRVVPGAHTRGRIDLSAGEPPGAVPVTAAAGDLLIHNRNLPHGSRANASRDVRVTVYFGFHARSTVEGVYTEEHIERRMRCIPLCIQERWDSGLFADESPFHYVPLPTVALSRLEEQAVLRAPPLAV